MNEYPTVPCFKCWIIGWVKNPGGGFFCWRCLGVISE